MHIRCSGLFTAAVRRIGIATALLLLAFGILWSGPAAAQPGPRSGRARVGLALSGGGARGFAHIGVLQKLEALGVPIDVVAGVSMGSVIGGLYAIGYTPGDLERLAVGQDWDILFDDSDPERQRQGRAEGGEDDYLFFLPVRDQSFQLPEGLIAGQQIAMLLSRLTLSAHDVRDFTALPVPFTAVATDLETGESVRLLEGSLAEAIRASLAIPGLFAPVEIGGRTFIDGGVTRNIPAEDARALGADVVICSDVSEPLQSADSLGSVVEILTQAVSFRAAKSNEAQRRICDIVIRPDITGISLLDFENAAEMIRRGAAAADSLRGRLQALAVRAGPGGKARRDSLSDTRNSVFVSRLRFEGVEEKQERRVRRLLGLPIPGNVTFQQLDEVLREVYATERFRTITYRFDLGPEGLELVVQAIEGERARLGVGLRFGSRYKAAILVRARLYGGFGLRSTLEADLRLGELLQARGLYTHPLRRTHVAVALAEATRTPIALFEDEGRVAEVTVRTLAAEGRFGTRRFAPFTASVGGRAEVFDLDQRVGFPTPSDRTQGHFILSALLTADTFERTAFPRHGLRLYLRSDVSQGYVGPGDGFTRHLLDGEVRFLVRERLSLLGRLGLGHAAGGGLPLHYRFYLGGDATYAVTRERQFPLLGFGVDELAGRGMQLLQVGAQFALTGQNVVLLRWNAARAGDGGVWRLDPEGFVSGFGLTLGRLTRIGPVELTLASRGLGGPYMLRVNAGAGF